MLNDKTVLITGGTGSFGRKFTETVLSRYKVKKLIIFSRDELKQQERGGGWRDGQDSRIRYFIGDVRDRPRLERALHGVDIVVHAAALKQVPACEYNPFEAVQTNIIGSKNVIDAAIDQGVQRVIAISTDKAVNPVNLYGATKLCAEKLFVNGNSYSGDVGTRLSCVRYGNVIGSRGSVVPLFQEQRKTGTVTVTDPRMTRFWITLDQGVDFVIKCIGLMQGGEVFVPRIPSVTIMDLVKAVAPECQVKYIGIRPGEKVHELLISEDESRNAVQVDNMYVLRPSAGWRGIEGFPVARPLPEGFKFTSDTNTLHLSNEELRALIQ